MNLTHEWISRCLSFWHPLPNRHAWLSLFFSPVAKNQVAGCSSSSLTSLPTLLCADVRGNVMLMGLKRIQNKPEQSIPDRVVPPYLYGVPTNVRAVDITFRLFCPACVRFCLMHDTRKVWKAGSIAEAFWLIFEFKNSFISKFKNNPQICDSMAWTEVAASDKANLGPIVGPGKYFCWRWKTHTIIRTIKPKTIRFAGCNREPGNSQKKLAHWWSCAAENNNILVTPPRSRRALAGAHSRFWRIGYLSWMERFNKILNIDELNLQAAVEPGVITEVFQNL